MNHIFSLIRPLLWPLDLIFFSPEPLGISESVPSLAQELLVNEDPDPHQGPERETEATAENQENISKMSNRLK